MTNFVHSNLSLNYSLIVFWRHILIMKRVWGDLLLGKFLFCSVYDFAWYIFRLNYSGCILCRGAVTPLSPKRGFLSMISKLHLIVRPNFRDLRSMEFTFIDIILRSTQTRSGNHLGSHYWVKWICLKIIRVCEEYSRSYNYKLFLLIIVICS